MEGHSFDFTIDCEFDSTVLNRSSSSGEDIDALNQSVSSSDSIMDCSVLSIESGGSQESCKGTDDIDSEMADSSFTDEEPSFWDELQSPLYQGSKLTKKEGYLLIMSYCLHNALTKTAVKDLLTLIESLLPCNQFISLFKFQKTFMALYHDFEFKKQYCCSNCHFLLEDSDSTCLNGCEDGKTEFLTVPVEPQLRRKLQDPATWRQLKEKSVNSGSELRDVCGGSQYACHHSFVSQPENVTLLVNTDGVKIFNSSSTSIWPIWIAINELLPQVRFHRHNILLGGLWYGERKPTMTTFLRPLIMEINKLSEEGFQVESPDGPMVARTRLLMCSLDLPAKATVLNMKQFNGEYGCTYCEDAGLPRPTTHLHRNWPYIRGSTKRTHSSILTNAKDSLNGMEAVKGVKGASILALHRHFNLAAGGVIDSMHCIFLGVMDKTLMTLWFDGKYRSKPFSIRNKRRRCDERLTTIQVPHDFNRAIKSLEHVKQWKASEFRSWVLYYSLPVLNDILPEPYLSHYALLVGAVHVFLSDNITKDMFLWADAALQKFCELFEELYGINSCTMNIHLLRHIPDCVKNWGPLWCYSCFAFESMNGQLKRHFHGTRQMNTQMALSYLLLQLLPKSCVSSRSRQNEIIGRTTAVSVDPQVQKLLSDTFNVIVNIASVFYRAVVRGEIFYSRQYKRCTSRNSYTVEYNSSNSATLFGFLEYFLGCPSITVAVVTPLEETHQHCYPSSFSVLSNRIISVREKPTICVIPLSALVSKCVCIHFSDAFYVVRLPNCIKSD